MRAPVFLLHRVVGGCVVGGRQLKLILAGRVNADGCGPLAFHPWFCRNGTSSWSSAAQQGSRLFIVLDFKVPDSRFQVHDCCILYLWLGVGTHNCCVQAVAWYHIGACMATGHGSYIRCLGSYIRCLEHPASSSFPCQYILPVTVHALD